jgi:hypothetical protein
MHRCHRTRDSVIRRTVSSHIDRAIGDEEAAVSALRGLLGGEKPFRIKGARGMTIASLRSAVASGARIVIYPYAESWLLVSFKRTTDPTLVLPGASRLGTAATPILHSLLFGWWGFPWGPIFTIQTIVQSARGGIDITDAVMPALEQDYAERPLELLPAS